MNIYLVGGAVRDQLLGRTVFDRDWVVVGASAQDLEAKGFKLVGQEFPVFIHPSTGEEYALARTERKAGKGYKGFEYIADTSVTLEQDLIRRDLTINAIAQSEDGTLFDYYGGIEDLNNRLLRHVSPAFAEDPLRVLRVARFAARFDNLGFTVAPETLALMQTLSEGDELSHLTIERVWKETDRALSEPCPERYFDILNQCHALEKLLPELTDWVNSSDFSAFSTAAQRLVPALNLTSERFAIALVLANQHKDPAQQLDDISDLCARLKTPKTTLEAAKIATIGYPRIHHPEQLTATELLELLISINILRKPENLDQLLAIGIALSPEHANLSLWWQETGESLRSISPAPFVKAGLKGIQIGAAIDAERLKRCQLALEQLT